MIGSKCFGHSYAQHQEITTIVLITTLAVPFLGYCCLEVVQAGWISVRAAGYSTQERDGQCGNQHYSSDLLMLGIRVPETF